jgi:hypothetical protein
MKVDSSNIEDSRSCSARWRTKFITSRNRVNSEPVWWRFCVKPKHRDYLRVERDRLIFERSRIDIPCSEILDAQLFNVSNFGIKFYIMTFHHQNRLYQFVVPPNIESVAVWPFSVQKRPEHYPLGGLTVVCVLAYVGIIAALMTLVDLISSI